MKRSVLVLLNYISGSRWHSLHLANMSRFKSISIEFSLTKTENITKDVIEQLNWYEIGHTSHTEKRPCATSSSWSQCISQTKNHIQTRVHSPKWTKKGRWSTFDCYIKEMGKKHEKNREMRFNQNIMRVSAWKWSVFCFSSIVAVAALIVSWAWIWHMCLRLDRYHPEAFNARPIRVYILEHE